MNFRDAPYAKEAKDRRIEVRVEAREADGEVVLQIADHGPGIPPAERERVFEEFYRPGEELTRESRGPGSAWLWCAG